MANPQSPKYYKVAMLLFPGADILDFCGPAELLTHVSHSDDYTQPDKAFNISYIAGSEIIPAASQLRVLRDHSLEQARADLNTYDILIIPGGMPDAIMSMIDPPSAELALIRDFIAQPRRAPGQQARVVFSVCTGALLLGAAGAFEGKMATTHHLCVDTLKQICGEHTEVLQRRYVDAGELGNGTRVLSAGGISSGLDATCYLIESLLGLEKVKQATDMAEYERRVVEAR
ncbi:hypothetical protein BP6252_09035 [Coleophoma cylindrospora]|uniref:DJ-1/PfpI domain-containing protein n=1 Tax=Coleophoma cylindrospora TaxID=1849047 RepID=A0A3D8R0S9_9HELO|nr:hypothetical protein BP6252_09035 [Coleophoma cylindrospora]